MLMKRFDALFTILQIPVDGIMLVFAAMCAYALRLSGWAVQKRAVVFDISLEEYILDILIILPIWFILYALFGLYKTRARKRFSAQCIAIIVANICGLALVALYIMFSLQFFDSRFLVVFTCFFAIIFTVFGRMVLLGTKKLAYYFGIGHRRIVIFGDAAGAKDLQAYFTKNTSLGYTVLKRYATLQDVVLQELQNMALDEIYTIGSNNNKKDALRILDFAQERNIIFTYSADIFATKSAHMEIYPVAGIPVVSLKRTPLEGWGKIIKRIADIIGSILLLILTSPIMLVAAIIILCETGRPILYKNKRVGYGQKPFFTLKFRSMFQKDSTGSQFGASGKEAEKREKALIDKQNTRKGPIYKIKNDPRVTSFGKCIRRWSVDELPQFVNVLKGEMSLIGPRPHQPREVLGYNKEHRGVFIVKPGMSGLAQISGRSDLSYEEELALDMLYIEKWSVWLDIIIFLKTPYVLCKRRTVA